jgi:hypothetical protein
MADPVVERKESRRVVLTNHIGEAVFLDGDLWHLELGQPGFRQAVSLPLQVKDTADRLTEYIEFLRFVRAEVRRLRDGAQESGE